ncbi:MAG: hypothetical protein AAGL69_02715 [Pseudomonadota bacterium]
MRFAPTHLFEIANHQQHRILIVVPTLVRQHISNNLRRIEKLGRLPAIDPIEVIRLFIEHCDEIECTADVSLQEWAFAAVAVKRLAGGSELTHRQRMAGCRCHEHTQRSPDSEQTHVPSPVVKIIVLR